MGKAKVVSKVLNGAKNSEELSAILRGDINTAKSTEEAIIKAEGKKSGSIPITSSDSKPASIKTPKTVTQDTTGTVQTPKTEITQAPATTSVPESIPKPEPQATPARQEAPSSPSSTQKTYDSLEQRLADVEDGRANNEMRKRMPVEFKNAKEKFVNAKNDEERANIMKNYGIENYKPGTSQEDVFKSLEQSFINKVDQGPSAGDYFNGYHGRSVLAVGVTGGVAANLFTSKGRLSNNQLYSDPFA